MKRITSSTCIIIALVVFTCATAVTSTVVGQESPSRSWADRLEYVGIAVEEPGYHVWGSSPVIGPAGKTHLFVARWKIEEQFKAWLTHCEIARYVSDQPEGPFVFQEVVVKGSGKKGDWDFQSPHNPSIQKVGQRYVLSYIANAGGTKQECVASQRIGMMIADGPEWPWKKVGDNGMILAPPTDPSVWSYQSSVGVNNPALLEHPDGRFFLYYKALKKGDVRRMGVAIADRVEGPYVFNAEPLTSNKTTIEDGYAFVENEKVYLLTTSNRDGTGFLWASDDGIHFSEPILGYDKMDRYLSPQLISKAVVFRGKKFERPQVLMQDGHPTYLYVASGANVNGGKGTHSCLFRIKRPESSDPSQR
ncbi:glycoside hydrolase family protein [Neorhodopirellula lusitana]|uniref:glycoside hydrolase family protein n=1 Tax=Neorhodopirellula lusitana TaxID=445327 RepID=UPI00384CBB6F